MAIVLGPNRYGKAETRLVRVVRDGGAPRADATSTSASRSPATSPPTHLTGDNADVLPTDTQKNTVYAFAKRARRRRDRGVRAAAGPALRRLAAGDPTGPGRRSRSTPGSGSGRTRSPATAARSAPRGRHHDADGAAPWVVSGLDGPGAAQLDRLGVPRLRRATSTRPCRRPPTGSWPPRSTARWRHADGRRSTATRRTTTSRGRAGRGVRRRRYSLLAAADPVRDGRARCSTDRPEVAEVRLALPNKHHFLVDLSPFGLDNPGEVFFAADRPYGLIEGTVLRDDAPRRRLRLGVAHGLPATATWAEALAAKADAPGRGADRRAAPT